jgi:hypothetical protein
MYIGTKIESGKILLVCMEYLSVFRKCIVPLLEIDVSLCLKKMKVEVIGILTYLCSKHFQGITPFLTCLG